MDSLNFCLQYVMNEQKSNKVFTTMLSLNLKWFLILSFDFLDFSYEAKTFD